MTAVTNDHQNVKEILRHIRDDLVHEIGIQYEVINLYSEVSGSFANKLKKAGIEVGHDNYIRLAAIYDRVMNLTRYNDLKEDLEKQLIAAQKGKYYEPRNTKSKQ